MPSASNPPQHVPSAQELDDLELLSSGALVRIGFGEGAGAVTLRVPDDVADLGRQHGHLDLVDPEGAPLGRVIVKSTYAARDLTGICGEVTMVRQRAYGAFRALHLPPSPVKGAYGAKALTVPVSVPLSVADLARVEAAAAGNPVVLLALVGEGSRSALSREGLIRATSAAARLLSDARVVAVPLAAREDADSTRAFRREVVAAYAPGEVLEVTGEGELPDEVAAVVRFDRPERAQQGLVILLTGLSGSGKSTLARALHDVLLEAGERTVTCLDGDVVRRNLSAGLSFSQEDRETNILRIGWVAAEISRHRGIAICSPIAPFDRTRQQVRDLVGAAGGGFFLVHVATPIEECERRDRKGLYAKARRGESPDFTGITSPYDEPTEADLRVDTTGRTVAEALEDILRALASAGYLRRG